jgi:hypothetical protein
MPALWSELRAMVPHGTTSGDVSPNAGSESRLSVGCLALFLLWPGRSGAVLGARVSGVFGLEVLVEELQDDFGAFDAVFGGTGA